MASWLKKPFTSFLWLLLLGCFLIGEVVGNNLFGEVRLKVLLTRFSNPLNHNADNQCCDGKKNASICTDNCDIFFVVCPSTASSSCVKSRVILQNSSEFTASQRNLTASSENTDGNFVSMFFKVNPEQFSHFSVRLYDDDSQDLLPNESQSLNETVIEFIEKLPTPVKSQSFHRNISRNNISFEFVYSLSFSCEKFFYGDTCQVYCRPRDDEFAHTQCLPNGTTVCLPGWEDLKISCTKPICPGGCVNGRCKGPNFCRCDSLWTGPTCEECVPDSRCLHATCIQPGNGCICKANWTGTYCNVYIDYCSRYHPCKNGECHNHNSKNFTCTCHSGWSGPKCDKFLCAPSCNLTNAVCTSIGECSCNAGWTGADCNQCLPKSNCTHGYCNGPFECVCEEGWGGENCTDPVIKSRCTQQNPCQNNGVCNDSTMGNYHCNCKQGFVGRHCEDKLVTTERPDRCSTWCNKSYGHCENNECRCVPGWRGLNCTECVRNSSCVNGFCRRAFECICYANWTGPSCNVSLNNECSSDSNSLSCGQVEERISSGSTTDNDKLIYILSSVLVLLIIVILLLLAWKLRRRRATFDVTSPEVVVNTFGKPSYIMGNMNGEKHELGLNNNAVSQKRTSPEVHLNPIALQPSQNSRSMLLANESEIYECNDVISNEDSSPDSSEYRII